MTPQSEAVASERASQFDLRLWVEEDPQAVGANVAKWAPGEGLPDRDGADKTALYLQKKTGTFTDSGAHAQVTGVEGAIVTELGWDIRNDGHIGFGAPRFSVRTEDGAEYSFSFLAGGIRRPSTPAPADPERWTRIRFRDEDAHPQTAEQPPWPGFGKAKVSEIDIVFDEGIDQGSGFTYLDNIDINGVLITGPTE